MTRAKIFISAIMAVLMLTASYSLAIAGTKAHTGTVVETITGGGYTYMNIEEKGNKFWIAGPTTSISKGAQVSFYEQVWMSNFTSKALNRTFDKILFVGGVNVGSAPDSVSTAAPLVPAPDLTSKAAPEVQPEAKSKTASEAKAKPKGPHTLAGTFTVKELHAKKAELNGRIVKVKGKVTKVLGNIMGMAWVHIEDGTGAEETKEIIFTSKTEVPAVGTTVTAEGTLEVDKDFGFGYFYPVIVEESKFTK